MRNFICEKCGCEHYPLKIKACEEIKKAKKNLMKHNPTYGDRYYGYLRCNCCNSHDIQITNAVVTFNERTEELGSEDMNCPKCQVIEKGCNLTDENMPCFCNGHNCTPGVCADCTYPSEPKETMEEDWEKECICLQAPLRCEWCKGKRWGEYIPKPKKIIEEDWMKAIDQEGCCGGDSYCQGIKHNEDIISFIKSLKSRWQDEAREEYREKMINNFKSVCELKRNGDVKYFKDEFVQGMEIWEDYLPQKILDLILNTL